MEGYSVVLRLSNGTSIERDFSTVKFRGPLARRFHRRGGISKHVRIKGAALAWPGGIDFELNNIVWGYPRPKGGQPLRRAIVGEAATLIPAPR